MSTSPSFSPSGSPPVWSDSVLASAASRPSVVQLTIKDKSSLFSAYMPLLKDGGIFIQTSRDYALGDELYLLLTLPEDPQRYAVAGLVAWVTPANTLTGRTQGVGIRFPSDARGAAVKRKIEDSLGALLLSDRLNLTV